MWENIREKLEKKMFELVSTHIEKIESSTKREKRLDIDDYKNLMIFEVDPQKLAEYQSKIDEIEEHNKVFNQRDYPELFI